jgi:uncharacterized protein
LPRYLIAAIAGRMLAHSARRGGYDVDVMDLFDDLDTRRYAKRSRVVVGRDGGLGGFDHEAFVLALREWRESADGDYAGAVYGSGFEDATDLLCKLRSACRLFGNTPETVERMKNPREFFPLLDELGIPHPEVAFAAPRRAGRWLRKRIGGSGGAHVAEAGARSNTQEGEYFQRFVEGAHYSVSFLANGRRARIIGFNEPWTVALGDWSYCYAGAISHVAIPCGVRAEVEARLDALVAATGLIGLNGMDFAIDARGGYHVIEVNPRPSGTLDLYDADWPQGLFHWHLRASDGELPGALPARQTIRAHAVVYTRMSFDLPRNLEFPPWCSDIPKTGATFAPGMPVCMVHAEGTDHGTVKRRIFERRDTMEKLIEREAA